MSIVGIDALSTTLKPISTEYSKQTEEVEREKALFEATDRKGKSSLSLLVSINTTKETLLLAADDAEN